MAINRGPWNALIDDDGTNTIGTPLNKQALKDVVLDPVDAALAAQAAAAGGAWMEVPFSAANFFGRDGMIWTLDASAVLRNRCVVLLGKTLVWTIYISWFTGVNTIGGTAGPTLVLVPPLAGTQVPGNQIVAAGFSQTGGALPATCASYLSGNGPAVLWNRADNLNFQLGAGPGLVTTMVWEIY